MRSPTLLSRAGSELFTKRWGGEDIELISPYPHVVTDQTNGPVGKMGRLVEKDPQAETRLPHGTDGDSETVFR